MTREELLASIIQTADRYCISFDEDRRIDWSHDDADGFNILIRNSDRKALLLTLSLDEIARLQRALTLLLLDRQP